jgi:quercetin dioxygenase-like cupin family protein
VAHEGQELDGPGGICLRLISISGELLAMEATYSGDGQMPPEHLHPQQAERFEVLGGAMNTIIGGTERRYDAGEVFEVLAGTPHQMAADGPARVRWEVRPALRTAEFFEQLYSGDVTDGAAFLREFSDEFELTGG